MVFNPKVYKSPVWALFGVVWVYKENDLVHGEFGKWLRTLNIDRTQAYRFIKVYEEIKDVGTYQHLGLRALSEIATLPEPERTKKYVTEKGETKVLLLILLYKENIIVINKYLEKSDYVVNL